MSYPKNAATPNPVDVGEVVLIADGTVQTSGASVRVNLDAGGWGAGGGTLAYDATSGAITYAPTQGETNGDTLMIHVYKADCLGCGVTVSMDPTDLAVNATKIGGTTQTGRDLGSSVLLSSGTGAGQLDFISGVVAASGNWNVGKTGYALTSQDWATAGDAMTLTRPPHHWYVTKGGNDSTGNGSRWLPYLTIGKAVTESAAGDTIHVGPGTYSAQVSLAALTNVTLILSQGAVITSATTPTLNLGGGCRWDGGEVAFTGAAGNAVWTNDDDVVIGLADGVSITSTDTGIYNDGGDRLRVSHARIIAQEWSIYSTGDYPDIEDISLIMDGWTDCAVEGIVLTGDIAGRMAGVRGRVKSDDTNANPVTGVRIDFASGVMQMGDIRLEVRSENTDELLTAVVKGISTEGDCGVVLDGATIRTAAAIGDATDLVNDGSPFFMIHAVDYTTSSGTITQIKPLANLDAAVSTRSSHTAAQAGTDAAGKVLATPANKLATSETGAVKLAADGLDSIPVTAPTGVAATFREMIVQLWRRFFRKAVIHKTGVGAGTQKTYADNGTTVVTTQTITDDGTDETQGAAS